MNKNLINDKEKVYKEAKKYGEKYWNELYDILENEKYIEVLKRDFEKWSDKHIKKGGAILSLLEKKVSASTKEYEPYLEWLNNKGKLNSYLERSISYIFMRDLGKDISEEKTVKKIQSSVDKIRGNVDKKEEIGLDIEKLYNKIKEKELISTMFWIIDKMKNISKNIPEEIDKTNAIRKIIKIIAGVLMYRMYDEVDDGMDMEISIKLGYSYGLTYPFIDDLLDSKILTEEEEEEYSDLIRETLLTGIVPEKEWNSKNKKLLEYICCELKEGFNYIKENQKRENLDSFLELSYVFFNAQELDRKKDLNNKYRNDEIFVPIILKSAASRLIVPAVLDMEEEYSFNSKLFYYGIYNQLADDFTDMEEDYKGKRVTPYTYYLMNNEEGINPFEVYLVVVYYLIHVIYENNEKVKDIILCRVINSLKRFKGKASEKKFNERMNLLKLKDDELNKIIRKMIDKAVDVDFYDKLLRDKIILELENSTERKKNFKEKVKNMKEEINGYLKIEFLDSKIKDAANYSLEGNGKRLRSIIAWTVGQELYGLNKKSMMPLIKSLEYMHTASLILDDLPAQDNADLRRGRATVHKKYNVAIGEISSLFLTQQGILEQTNLVDYSKEQVLKLIKYSTEAIQKMCLGQEKDLSSKGKVLTIKELEEICFYKTGIAFEAALIMPAILGNASEKEIIALKNFAKFAGIAFQIKDDMLDSKGDIEKIGKEIKIDEKNETSTFVTILGYEEAEKSLIEYYVSAIKSLKNIDGDVEFLRELMNYILNRER